MSFSFFLVIFDYQSPQIPIPFEDFTLWITMILSVCRCGFADYEDVRTVDVDLRIMKMSVRLMWIFVCMVAVDLRKIFILKDIIEWEENMIEYGIPQVISIGYILFCFYFVKLVEMNRYTSYFKNC